NAKEWTSIGSSSYPFKGNFDGNNYTINGLYKNSLFGHIYNGSVKNLTMGTGYIYSYSYNVGSIASYIYNTTISNCTNNGTIVSSSYGHSGGLVGKMESSEISSSDNYANVSSTYGYAGGIVGYAEDDNSYCFGCHNYGTVSGYYTKSDIVGNWENTENKDENDWSYPAEYSNQLWSGSGASYDPYIIKTAQDLANLAYMINNSYNSYENTYFSLANNIDLNYGISVNEYSYNAKQWTSIGNSSYSFRGNFDGNGYTIDGLYGDSLFGYISNGSITNLTMGNGYVDNINYFDGYYNAGSIAGYIYNTTISNCKNNGTTVTYSPSPFVYIGGLVGEMKYSSISDSSNNATVSSSSGYAGGIAGYMTDSSNISNSSNNATVSSSSGHAGGIAGYMTDSSNISNSYNYANISSSYNYAGGIAGYADYNSSYYECYNYGSILGSTQGNIAGNENDWSYPTSRPQRLWSGSGSSSDPYIIKTAQDLANLAYMVNNGTNYNDTYFRLDNDIDLNNGISVNEYSSNAKEWTSIGSSSYPFKGNFDGNNYTIDGLYNGSLFVYISEGSVTNLTMGTGYIYSYNVSSIADYIYNTTISNCTNNGTIVSMSSGYSGGLVGKMENSEISNSSNYANVSSTNGAAGGIAGIMYNSNISYSDNHANVSSTDGAAGGIAGIMYNSNISYSDNHATVSSSYSYAGGIVGYAEDDNSSCSGCYNSGYVSGSTQGDIIGNR
ncbi:MAG: hypothetical protein HDR52_04480, partial [Treponema sp.]|nr:hypothetical protein [Treponema sp.]